MEGQLDISGEEGKVRFHINWKPNLDGPGIRRNSHTVVTCYGSAYYEWTMHVDRLGGGLRDIPFGFHNAPRRYELKIQPVFQTLHVRRPIADRCHFEVTILEKNDTAVRREGPLIVTVSMDFNEHPEFRVPCFSPIGQLVQEYFSASNYSDKICMISVTMELPLRAFGIGTWTTAAPQSPLIPDWRFNLLNDRNFRNFALQCTDGIFCVNRAAFFVSSSFFRNCLKIDPTTDKLNLEYSKAAVEMVIVYMMSGTFKPPPEPFTPKLAGEVLRLAAFLRVMSPMEFRCAVERLASEQLIQSKEDMDIVVLWLIVAHELDLPRLRNSSVSILINLHFNQFNIEHGDSNVVKDKEKESIHGKLHNTLGIFRPQPFMQIMTLARLARNVQTTVSEIESAE